VSMRQIEALWAVSFGLSCCTVLRGSPRCRAACFSTLIRNIRATRVSGKFASPSSPVAEYVLFI